MLGVFSDESAISLIRLIGALLSAGIMIFLTLLAARLFVAATEAPRYMKRHLDVARQTLAAVNELTQAVRAQARAIAEEQELAAVRRAPKGTAISGDIPPPDMSALEEIERSGDPLACPSCGARLKLPPNAHPTPGAVAKCPKCKASVPIG